MGKQTKSRKPEKVVGKGKVTPVQVAFIVDRYLSDNNFVETRSTFRTEASLLISKSSVIEAPKSLLSLGDILDEYIRLKEQKVILNQEKTRLEQEKLRVQTLLRGMQNVMNAYNAGEAASANALPPPVVMPVQIAGTMVPHGNLSMMSPAVRLPLYDTRVLMSTSRPSITPSDPTSQSTPVTSQPTLKRRKNSEDAPSAPLAAKRSRSRTSAKQSQTSAATQSLPQPSKESNNQETGLQITSVPSTSHASAPSTLSPIQGSTVAKRLFNQSNHSPGPQTPSPSPTDKSVSPLENHTPPTSNNNDIIPQQFTSTNCTVITSETIEVSPSKKVSYYSIERNHSISSPNMKRFSKRDHVKGRLDFDGSETVAKKSKISVSDGNTESPSENGDEAFDFDLPSLDCLGADFNLTELLGDFNIVGERMEYLSQPVTGSPPESLSGSPDTPRNGNVCDHELLSGISSTVTEIRSEQDMSMPGPNSVTSVKSITKCIKVFSPAKSHKSTRSDLEISSARD